MNFFIVGCGSIGERHVRNLKTLGVDELLVHDINEKRLNYVAEKYGAKPCSSIDIGLEEAPEGVLVCTPPNMHMPTALKAAKKGCNIFIEKPMSHNLEGVDDLIQIAEEKGIVLMVGYNLRFHPGITAIKELLSRIGRITNLRAEFGQYLPEWRPGQDYRKSYSANRSLGGGIILDAIHEIDYARWFLGDVKEVLCLSDKLSNLDIDTEDTAEILLKFNSGVIGEIHLDYVQRTYSRNCKIIGEEGTIQYDYKRNTLTLFPPSDSKEEVIMKDPDYDPNKMYVQEMEHFIECIKQNKKPLSDGENGKRTLEIALAARASSDRGEVIKL